MILSLAKSSTQPVAVRWLWRPYLAAGKITLLDGDPQCGKSLITVDVAARLSRAAPLPDGSAATGPLRTMILNAEDDVADTVTPRLLAADADLEQVFVPDADQGDWRFPGDLPVLEEMVRSAGVHLLVIDPFLAFVPPELSTGVPAIVGQVLRPLAALAARTNLAILLVRHLRKQGSDRAIFAGLGAVGITGLARTGLLAARDPANPDECVLAVAKTNLAAAPATLRYRAQDRNGVARIDWLGPTDTTPDALCADPPAKEPVGLIRAINWLLEALNDGPRPAIDLLAAARAAGIAERTLERAKFHLQVESQVHREKNGTLRTWMWHPPEDPPDLSFLSPLPDLPPFDVPWEEAPTDHLSPKARDMLDRDKLKWAGKHLK